MVSKDRVVGLSGPPLQEQKPVRLRTKCRVLEEIEMPSEAWNFFWTGKHGSAAVAQPTLIVGECHIVSLQVIYRSLHRGEMPGIRSGK